LEPKQVKNKCGAKKESKWLREERKKIAMGGKKEKEKHKKKKEKEKNT
jgi:hypothetical protein